MDEIVGGALGLLLVVAPGVIAALKGKYGMVTLGLFVHVCWWFAAIRLAKPNSFWARHFYDTQTLGRAQVRYPARSATTTNKADI